LSDFVLDASVAMAWCFEDEATPYTEAVLQRLTGAGALVTAVWPYEVGNVLLGAERRGRITQSQAMRFLELLRALPISVDEHGMTHAWADVMALGRAHRLTAYDAAYLELAARTDLPLASQDEQLLQASRAVGVVVIAGPSDAGRPPART
jgi:predicted nucleic acid-binding protein